MAKKRMYLHIGTHKTATTTIQAGCVENRELLLAAGYLYPTTGVYLFGQHNIAWEMAEGRPQPWNHVSTRVAVRTGLGNMQDLLAEIEASAAQRVILSSEDFDGLHHDRIYHLKNCLNDYDVEVIVYFREQTSLWQSAWAQFIKSGYVTDSFSDWAEGLLAAPPQVQRYFGRYDLFLIPWAQAFGKQNIHVRRYGVDAYGSTIFCDFLRLCGVPDEQKFSVPANQNISPGYPALELIRFFGQGEVDPAVRSRICGLVQRFLKEHGGMDGKFHLVSADLSERMVAHFLPFNQSVAEEYLGLDELFPAPKPKLAMTEFTVAEMDPGLFSSLEAYISDELSK